MLLRHAPAGVDTVNNTNEHKFKTREELEAFYKAQLAKDLSKQVGRNQENAQRCP